MRYAYDKRKVVNYSYRGIRTKEWQPTKVKNFTSRRHKSLGTIEYAFKAHFKRSIINRYNKSRLFTAETCQKSKFMSKYVTLKNNELISFLNSVTNYRLKYV